MSAPAPSMFSSAANLMADRLGLAMGRANLETFAVSLQSLATADRDIVVVTSDSRGSAKLGAFGHALPAQLVEVGIAEQNLVGVAAGLAAAGKKSFAVSAQSPPMVTYIIATAPEMRMPYDTGKPVKPCRMRPIAAYLAATSRSFRRTPDHAMSCWVGTSYRVLRYSVGDWTPRFWRSLDHRGAMVNAPSMQQSAALTAHQE